MCYMYFSLVFVACSSFLLLPMLPFGLVLRAFRGMFVRVDDIFFLKLHVSAHQVECLAENFFDSGRAHEFVFVQVCLQDICFQNPPLPERYWKLKIVRVLWVGFTRLSARN